MNWYENLYVGKNAQERVQAYIQKIEDGKFPFQVFLITLVSGEHDQMEILSSRNLKFWYNREKCPLIVGVALGREEALEVLQQIVQDVLRETDGLDFSRYFISKTEQPDTAF